MKFVLTEGNIYSFLAGQCGNRDYVLHAVAPDQKIRATGWWRCQMKEMSMLLQP